jgi:hypothetical protein
MAMSYRIDPARRLVHCRAWGTLTREDLHDHYRGLVIDPHFEPHFQQFGDLREVDAISVDRATIAEVAKLPVFDAGVRRAIVAPSDFAFGIGRMFATYAESADQNVRVFREIDEAREWLDISDCTEQ